MKLLLADDDAGVRSLVGAVASERVRGLAVLEAADGLEAIEIGLRRRPEIALLDVGMPRLGGLETALALRELEPRMRIALHTGDPGLYRDDAREHCLPLFDKLELERVTQWLEVQAHQRATGGARRRARWRELSFACATCGYGIARSIPPDRCPMCQSEVAWVRPAFGPPRQPLDALLGDGML
jgi:CheY-like chemotaxis protein